MSFLPQKIKPVANGRWKKSEDAKFMKALQKHGRDWIKVQKMVKTRSLAQVRSHAQKAFLMMSDIDIQALIAPSDKEQDCKYEKNLRKNIKNMDIQAQKIVEKVEQNGNSPKNKMQKNADDDKNEKCLSVTKSDDNASSHHEIDIHSQHEIDIHYKEQNLITPFVSKIPISSLSFFMTLMQDDIMNFIENKNFLQLFSETIPNCD